MIVMRFTIFSMSLQAMLDLRINNYCIVIK